MRASCLLLISANVVVNAFPNIWGSGSSAAVEADIPNLGPNVIIVRPIDPTNSEQISKAGENLRNICGSEHVRAHQTSDGTPSWLVTLSDRETLQYLPATRDFINTKLTNPDQEIIEFTYPGTSHVLGWGHVQLREAAKSELEAYAGIVSPLGEDGPVDDERAVSDSGLEIPRNARASRLSGMIHSSYMAVTSRLAIFKRAITWTKQAPASWDLNMVSQPKSVMSSSPT
ncbi:hypothetical protein IAQ61_004479 [Plenodomus lingam]|uniref:uncharacterized protein n=1 Tax=Leptosphaeria maculans TaxID=5022 RepID=UPI0033210031|nr:hypothetical protein IAQ61_004479 [Plenodomus lingam]